MAFPAKSADWITETIAPTAEVEIDGVKRKLRAPSSLDILPRIHMLQSALTEIKETDAGAKEERFKINMELYATSVCASLEDDCTFDDAVRLILRIGVLHPLVYESLRLCGVIIRAPADRTANDAPLD